MIRCLRCDALRASGTLDAPCPACGVAPERIDGFVAFAPELARAGAGFEPEYFAELAPLEAGNFWFRARSAAILRVLRRYAARFASYLEVGCGTGFVLSGIAREFPGRRYFGSEVFVDGLPYAQRRVDSAVLLQMDATRIPFRDEFDAIGAFDVLEHIADDERAIAEAYAALRPGGAFIATVPQHPALWGPSDTFARHERRYRRNELQRKLEAAGFRVRYTTSIVTLLLPVLFASRWIARRTRDYDARAELRLPRALNAVLHLVMQVESMLLAAGLRMPVGGTRLVLAEKPA